VRPFASPALFRAVLEAVREHPGAITAVAATDTVKRVRDGLVAETLPREEIHLVQTPQAFQKDVIVHAHEQCRRLGWRVTDDASLLERLGLPVAVVPGERTNVKITTPEDLLWAEWFTGKTRRESGRHASCG
jgi:2-C-methyl-D-erythritol 4-phosphate cytidylyltransferase